MNEKDLPFKEKMKLITSKIMYKELNENELINILSEYFYNPEEYQEQFYKIFVRGLKYSFDSENPMQTAGIFYRNSVKINPKIFSIFQRRLAKMYKNMIMRKSSTGIKIESYDEFYDITLKLKMNFNIDPPSTNSILESFIKDENSINRILEDFSFYKIVEDIFLHEDNKCLEILDNELIFQLKEQSAKLQINKVFIIDKDRIESINLRLQHIENKTEYILFKQCKEFNF